MMEWQARSKPKQLRVLSYKSRKVQQKMYCNLSASFQYDYTNSLMTLTEIKFEKCIRFETLWEMKCCYKRKKNLTKTKLSAMHYQTQMCCLHRPHYNSHYHLSNGLINYIFYAEDFHAVLCVTKLNISGCPKHNLAENEHQKAYLEHTCWERSKPLDLKWDVYVVVRLVLWGVLYC